MILNMMDGTLRESDHQDEQKNMSWNLWGLNGFQKPLYREGRPLLQALDAALPVADQQDEHERDLS